MNSRIFNAFVAGMLLACMMNDAKLGNYGWACAFGIMCFLNGMAALREE